MGDVAAVTWSRNGLWQLTLAPIVSNTVCVLLECGINPVTTPACRGDWANPQFPRVLLFLVPPPPPPSIPGLACPQSTFISSPQSRYVSTNLPLACSFIICTTRVIPRPYNRDWRGCYQRCVSCIHFCSPRLGY